MRIKPYRTLFVCTGNICRSPTAEAVFRHHIEKLGLEAHLETDSAGTHAYHVDEPPYDKVIKAAERKGYKGLEPLRARKFNIQDFDRFHLILAMDRGHHRILDTHKPDDGIAQIQLFSDFLADTKIKDIPDPYYGDDKDCDQTLALIEHGVNGLLSWLEKNVLEKE